MILNLIEMTASPSEEKIEIKKTILLQAVGSKDPKAIDDAIKDFEETSEATKVASEAPLKSVVRLQIDELQRKDSRHLFDFFLIFRFSE